MNICSTLNMKFYVTGRSTNIAEVTRTIALIKIKGHQITFDWPTLPMVRPYEDDQEKAATFAKEGIQGVIDADICILLASNDGTGVFTELGAALALAQLHGKLKLYAVAREIPPAMFQYHPAITWVNSIEEVGY